MIDENMKNVVSWNNKEFCTLAIFFRTVSYLQLSYTCHNCLVFSKNILPFPQDRNVLEIQLLHHCKPNIYLFLWRYENVLPLVDHFLDDLQDLHNNRVLYLVKWYPRGAQFCFFLCHLSQHFFLIMENLNG